MMPHRGDPCHDRGNCPRPWETRVAWLLRVLIVGTAVGHVLQGKYLYALLCVAVIAVIVAPPLLARTSLANIPVELELAALWGAVSDMTLGRMAGLYTGTIWFDKVLHFGNSLLVGLLAFLIVYALPGTWGEGDRRGTIGGMTRAHMQLEWLILRPSVSAR